MLKKSKKQHAMFISSSYPSNLNHHQKHKHALRISPTRLTGDTPEAFAMNTFSRAVTTSLEEIQAILMTEQINSIHLDTCTTHLPYEKNEDIPRDEGA